MKKIFENKNLSILLSDNYRFHLFEKFSKIKILNFKIAFFLSNTRHKKCAIRNIFDINKTKWGQMGTKWGHYYLLLYTYRIVIFTPANTNTIKGLFWGLASP